VEGEGVSGGGGYASLYSVKRRLPVEFFGGRGEKFAPAGARTTCRNGAVKQSGRRGTLLPRLRLRFFIEWPVIGATSGAPKGTEFPSHLGQSSVFFSGKNRWVKGSATFEVDFLYLSAPPSAMSAKE